MASMLDPDFRATIAVAEREQRVRDWPLLGLYRGENAGLRAEERPEVVFIGDSITEFWPLGDPDLFSRAIVGRGIVGQTSPQILVRFYADAIALKPKAIHLLAGFNDIVGNTGPTTPQDYKHNVLAMSAIAAANGIQLLLAAILPCRSTVWYPDMDPAPRIAELNDWLRTTAAQSGTIYVDYFSALVADDGTSIRPELANDGLHPNTAGYSAMRPVADAALAGFLTNIPD